VIAERKNDGPYEVYRELCDLNPTAIIAKGFEPAYLGFSVGDGIRAVYDYDECIAVLIHEHSYTDDEAETYLLASVISASMDENSPIFVRTQ
jgi:hypothetical protein